MPGTKYGFRWNYDQIRPSLKSAEQKGRAYLSRITTYHALRAEAYAKINAPWTDRTTNARNALAATADNSRAGSNHWEINIYQGMDYGIWLEIRWGGKYGIIRPTLRDQAPQYWATAQEVLDKMFGSGS